MDFKGFDKDFNLRDKVAVVTGAASGIGKSVAQLYADKQAFIVLVDIKENVDEVAKEINDERTIAITADITKRADIEMVLQKVKEKFGRVDILFNSAGVALLDKAEDLSEEYWDKTMELNLKASFVMSQVIGKEMIEQGGGKVINMASQAALVALDKHVAYCASKAAIVSMTKVLAME